MGLLSVLFERPPATIVPPAAAPASVEDIALPHALDAETYDDPVTSHAVRCLESDILAVIQSVSLSAESGRTLILEMQGEIDRIRNGMGELVDQGRHAADDAAALAWNSSQIASASRQVSHVFTTTQSEFVEVAQAASQTTGLLAELARATDEISGIVQAIAGVANQTKLLALNASIEAARAGTAGRGFAVVANEVRNLSIETSGSANDIAQRIARLNASARTSIVAVERILAAIQRVKPHFETVDGSMETQIAAIVELAQRAAKNSQFVNSVCETAGQIDLATSNATHRIAETRQVAENTADIANDLGRRFVVAFRETPFGNRRTERRYPVNLQAAIRLPGGTRPLRCIDISRRGLRLHLDAASTVEWSGPRPIEIETLGEAEIRLVSRSETSLHCEFVGMGAEVSDRIDALISRLDGDYDKLIILMQDTASQISGCFVQALRTGRISENDLFDMNYQPVPDTDPEQFTTRALPFLEEVLPPIQEPMLAMDPKIVFCTAVDINGWLPVHHAACSLPQRRGDRAWNIANCRNRRFYDFRHGIFAARAMRPFIIKSYLRDLGGGEPVILASVDVPLRVLGQNWGGVRMGYSL